MTANRSHFRFRSCWAVAGVALALLAGAGAAQARSDVYWSVGVGVPGVVVGASNAPSYSSYSSYSYYTPPPVYYTPPPPPVYYTSPPVYYAPPPPVYYTPRPSYHHRPPAHHWRGEYRGGRPGGEHQGGHRNWR